MLTLIFVFMLLNLTIIWKLPSFSIGGRGHDGVPRIVGTRARFIAHGHAQKASSGTIPQWGQPLAMIPYPSALDSPVSHLPSQSESSPPYPVGLNFACIMQRVNPSLHAAVNPAYHHTVFW